MVEVDKLLSSINYDKTGLRILLQEYYDEFKLGHKEIEKMYSEDQLQDLGNYIYQLRTSLEYMEEVDTSKKLNKLESQCRLGVTPSADEVISVLTSLFVTNKHIESVLLDLEKPKNQTSRVKPTLKRCTSN
ncbi:hypothetical protein JCM19231_4989 [Vibrio ishigakensis]|uniref:Uncharacterized protein n=1 Tax=Vibrio ishigakensis TaxID=1481914 RepID=A0A0B8NXP2_9VIBR|nr:hypothetical protein [Vibrio ishigakensis]GAM59320.1 hypothetical protein JCM19231_4989 [Vibrio ishigakensis]GAM78224.1 hypothetical protein JCM19241_4929 [Vibrio ishigakensis]